MAVLEALGLAASSSNSESAWQWRLLIGREAPEALPHHHHHEAEGRAASFNQLIRAENITFIQL